MFKPVDSNINFPEMEKKWLKLWYESGIVKKYLRKNDKSEKRFSFLDGPITANNPMGVHHAWGRTYKDLWPRFYNLLGYRQRFQNGFDCQGLWVEVEVEKELKLKNKKEIENLVPGDRAASIDKFVELCKARVRKYSSIQTAQSKRLGYFADWDNSYFTMSDENNYMIWHFLKVCFENGWIYKGHESVPWCPRCETAISEHEILTEDYKEITHEAIYFKLKVKSEKLKADQYLLVWTTTPWTIPANIAVAVDSKFNYSLSETKEGEHFWLLTDLAKSVLGTDFKRIVKTVKGKELVGLKYQGPFDDLPAVKKVASANPKTFHTVVPTDEKILPITLTEGTGMVHTAVSAGAEDFKLGRKLGLPLIPVIGDNADYLTELGFLSGKNAKKNPRIILDYLEKEKWAYKIHNYTHRYPACWRCKTELVWKVADEWYISMDKGNPTLRQKMTQVAKKIKWMPEFGLSRELDWLKNMHNWLISKKNRYWGLALPIYECKKCHHFEVLGSKDELKKRAISGWDKFAGHTPHKPWIDEVKIKCSNCDETVSRINDVGNPWLDAGIVPYSTITENNQGEPLYLKNKNGWKKWFPPDFITESFPGQFKNWFYALIAESTVLEVTIPFKRVLGFGTLLGEDGRPMHKSWGNSIEFGEGADKIGVDVMRWMYCRQNPADNMLFGYRKADEIRRQFYLMLWNIYKFFVEYANLDKFEKPSNKIPKQVRDDKKPLVMLNLVQHPGEKGNILDEWILSRFVGLVSFVEESLKRYDARDATVEVEKFVSDLSTWYIRRSRDRVWVNTDNEADKKNFYSTLYYILTNLSIILSPFIPFIAEEMYTNLTDEESVNLADWPQINSEFRIQNSELEENMTRARVVVEAGHAWRKSKSLKVRTPLAKITLDMEGDYSGLPDEIWQIVLAELNVRNIEIGKKVRYPKKEVIVSEDELRKEGELRDLIRRIQSERKTLGLAPTDKVEVTVPQNFLEDVDYIKRKIMASKIEIGEELKIKP